MRGQDPDTGSLRNCLYHALPQFGLVASLLLLGTQVGLPPWLILNMECERVILPCLDIKTAMEGTVAVLYVMLLKPQTVNPDI